MNDTKKNRPKSQIMLPNSTSPLPPHSRKNGSSDSLPNHRYENEWEVRSKELAEAKCRVAQMEKTMRWWSDCTDNWRKKWSEVKTERNDLRKELRVTRNQLEKLMKQMSSNRQNDRSAGPGVKVNGFPIYSNAPPPVLTMSTNQYSNQPPFSGVDDGLSKKNAQTQTSALNTAQMSVIDKEIVSLLEEKVAHLTRKLDEVNRRFVIERDDKSRLEVTVERLRRDLSDLHELYDSLKKELSDINGKEFTESEVESYAEEDVHETEEEARLINQLAENHDGDIDDLELEDENETEIDKHTPTGDSGTVTAESTLGTSQDVAETGGVTDPKCDLASSIHMEIFEVHKKLDLKTFINDVTQLTIGSSDKKTSTVTVTLEIGDDVETEFQTKNPIPVSTPALTSNPDQSVTEPIAEILFAKGDTGNLNSPIAPKVNGTRIKWN